MAKDSASSRIPRLDGVTRIPVPGSIRQTITATVPKSQISQMPAPKFIPSQSRPSSYAGSGNNRTQVINTPSVHRSNSGDRISDAVKKTTDYVKKFWSKSTSGGGTSTPIDPRKAATNSTVILEKTTTTGLINPLLTRSESSTQRDQQAHNETRTLTRSETFIRDSNPENESNILAVTHNIGSTGELLSSTKSDNNESALFMTHAVVNPSVTIAMDTTTTVEAPGLTSNDHVIRDITIPLSDKHLTHIMHEQSSPNVWNCPKDLLRKYADLSSDLADDTIVVAPDKTNMKLVLNSTMNYDRLIDVSTMAISPTQALMNLTRDLHDSPQQEQPMNTTKLLYMTNTEEDMDATLIASGESEKLDIDQEDQSSNQDDPRLEDESMEVDEDLPRNVAQMMSENQAVDAKNKARFSFGMDLTECTLDCSIELCDVSLSSSIPAQSGSPLLKKQHSFEMDESLGILTPDQMKEFLDSATTGTNLDLPINMHSGSKLAIHQMRIDQTPSPEDLPLDPVGVKTDLGDVIMSQPIGIGQSTVHYNQQELSQTDSYSKTDQMTKSNVSKVSNSFITSITSITSLDTGYQGDGEMSRPASRGAGDHSPSNGPRKPLLGRQPSFNQNVQQNIPIRRQDPMTDSDFFTESDADDIFHRGDRRAQVIDGQLYGPMLQPANVFITEQPQMEDSCMESSGIFTDVENRCDEDLIRSRGGGNNVEDASGDVDMSPDGSTDTVKSNNTEYNTGSQPPRSSSSMSQGHSNVLTDSQTSSTIQSSISSERISVSSVSGFGRCTTDFTAQQKTTSTKSSPSTQSIAENVEPIKKSNSSTTCSDKKSSPSTGIHANAKKLQQTSLSAVKKFSPSRKQQSHQYGSNAERNSSVVATSREISKHENKAGAKKSAILSPSASKAAAARLKSRLANNGHENDFTNNAEMLVKNGTPSTPLKSRNIPNQENRRPVGSRAGSVSSDVSNEKCNGHSGVLIGDRGGNSAQQQQQVSQSGVGGASVRKASPNKWDAVMNKIAESKALKKNYSQVKSKVSSGMGLLRCSNGGTPRLTKSPTTQSQDSNCESVNSSSGAASGLSSPQTKCALIQGVAKRGRSFSKDSQQSSQSDLSLSGGSAKHQVKASPSTRSAKKRDVRTLSISPTDLGPPPKTQTNTATVRTKHQPVIAAPKRISSNISQTTTPSPTTASPPLVASKQGSPPPKKVISRRPQVQQTHTKVPLKDHNRLLGHSQQQQQQTPPQQQHSNANSPKSGIRHSLKSSNASSTSSSPAPPQTTKTTTTSAATTLASGTALVCGGLKVGSRNSLKSPQPSGILQHSKNAVVSSQQQQQLLHGHKPKQQQQHQQIKSSQGAVNFHLVHANKGFEALSVLFQYLVYDLDAFSCPKVKNEYKQAKDCLFETRRQLEEEKATCVDLQDQLHEKDLYYTTRESELQTLHRCELEKVQSSLADLETNAQERIRSLQDEIVSANVAHEKQFKDYQQRAESQLLEKDTELSRAKEREQELLKRINELSTTENELREKVQASEQSFAERLADASKREHELAEKVNTLSKELNLLQQQTENRERDLKEKLDLSYDEISVLRNSRSLADQSLSPKRFSSAGLVNGSASKMQMFQEVESLRCVLELKQTELSELRKQNQELKRASDDLPLLQVKLSAMESRVEDLQIQLKAKADEEKDLIQRNKSLHESYKQELEQRSRLSLHNEELQWKLKQNSEKFALVVNELSKNYSDQSSSSLLSASKTSLHNYSNAADCSQHLSGLADQPLLSSSHNSSLASLNRSSDRMVGCFQMDDVSPPASPIIKGVVEKNDSVSWVLEMDDETPEVLASRMIRRAGSFRLSFNEKSPGARRQNSLPVSNGGNPLMQSASATSVLRQHSNESVSSINSSASNASSTRIRSKSVTMKSADPKKCSRQNSMNGSSDSRTLNGSSGSTLSSQSSRKDTLLSSSPYARHQRSSSLKQQLVSPTATPSNSLGRRSSFNHDDEESLYRKQSYNAPNLITCDTSALTAAENRLEIRSLPSHPSVQDLKGLKKCQEIQESAGEAMVSGTNSEDEGCSASSDDIISSASSADSATSSLDCNGTEDGKGHVFSLEEALMNKITASLSGTPMEVSWSDDVDQFTSGESIV